MFVDSRAKGVKWPESRLKCLRDSSSNFIEFVKDLLEHRIVGNSLETKGERHALRPSLGT